MFHINSKENKSSVWMWLAWFKERGIRGQFEERMQKLMEEIRKREDIILFIDESMKLSVQVLQAMAIWMLEISSSQPLLVENCNWSVLLPQ